MTSRQRVRCALSRKGPDRIPYDLWSTPEMMQKLRAHFDAADDEGVLSALGVDLRQLLVDYIGPQNTQNPDGTRTTMWGGTYRSVSYGDGAGTYDEAVKYPLADVDSVEGVYAHKWPDPEWWDYASVKREIEKADAVDERWLGVGYSSTFEHAWGTMGLERFLCELSLRPEIACAVMDVITDFWIEMTLRILDAAGGRIDMVYTYDDLGTQNGPLISPDMYRRYVKPREARFIRAIRARHNVVIFQHSCGSIVPVIDDLIEIGIDVLNPIQPKARGMDADSLGRRFGARIAFHGGVDIQELLPYGTADEVRAEVRRLINTLGRSGGYILAPAHAIQPDTPLENVLAIYEEARKGFD